MIIFTLLVSHFDLNRTETLGASPVKDGSSSVLKTSIDFSAFDWIYWRAIRRFVFAFTCE